VASLLEVGTGFHPELTGRENIFLNGAILGMTHREIKRKFDEIVAFADADKFLDTPVKRYSSGMQVRLAFAVAAHLEPEILVVDEVLAVGDAEFQKKCLGKMEDVSKDGRTVLFVSHTMSAVRRLCRRGMVLDQGRVIYNGAAPEAIDFYMGIGQQTSEAVFARKRGEPSIIGVRIDSDAVRQGHVLIDIAFASPIPLHNPVPGFVLYSAAGTPVFGSNPRIHSDGYASSTLKQGVISFSALDVPICSGHYRLSVWLGDWHRDYDYKPEAVAFDFINPREPLNRSSGETIGHLTCPGQWRLSDEQSSSSNSYIEPEATRNLVSSAELDVD
jgi:lipopolysaccharide transport system ATP-binding protein